MRQVGQVWKHILLQGFWPEVILITIRVISQSPNIVISLKVAQALCTCNNLIMISLEYLDVKHMYTFWNNYGRNWIINVENVLSLVTESMGILDIAYGILTYVLWWMWNICPCSERTKQEIRLQMLKMYFPWLWNLWATWIAPMGS